MASKTKVSLRSEHDQKTRSSENTHISKKDAEKNFEKEDEEKKKRLIGKKKGTYLKNTLVKNIH